MDIVIDAMSGSRVKNVLQNTWGHLAPKKNVKYKARIVIACDAWEETTIFLAEFKDKNGEELDESPWLRDIIGLFLNKFGTEVEVKWGCIYEWNGFLRNNKLNGSIKMILDTTIPTS